nr:MFS transporter [Klebsiella pneumoniae]
MMLSPGDTNVNINTVSDNGSPAAVEPQASSQSAPLISRGTVAFRKLTLFMFIAGSASFAMLYCVQPVLPVLSESFNITPAQSSLSLSVATMMMAVGLLFTGTLSDALGRRRIMMVSLLLAALCTGFCAVMPNWYGVVIMRALTGLALSGVAAVAMTYISEEVHPSVLPLSMGLYISGNSIGSVSGRLITSVITDYTSWHAAFSIIGVVAILSGLYFCTILPESRQFKPVKFRPSQLVAALKQHWRDPGLPWLFLTGFVLMGVFVTLFNYISYRFADAPYHLSQTIIGLMSVVYLSGTLSSPKAGLLSARYGRGKVLISALSLMLAGVLLTVFSAISLIAAGLVLVAAGFFAGHSVASSWIGRRAKTAKGQASSQYLFFYYLGSSVAGTVGGLFWNNFGWNGVVCFLMIILAMGISASLKLWRTSD